MKDHSPECLAELQRREALREAYTIAWPDHCEHCKGWGQFCYSYDPSPAGVSLAPGKLIDCDPCPECAEKGRCPRCGSVAVSPEGDECFRCGWNLDAEGMPPPAECTCWAEGWEREIARVELYAEDDWVEDLGEQVNWDFYFDRGY